MRKSLPQVVHDYLFEAAAPDCAYLLNHGLDCAIQKSLRDKGSAMSQVDPHDLYIYIYSRADGFKWFIDGYIGLGHRQHASNQVGVDSGFAALKARSGRVFNGWWLRQAREIAELAGFKHDPFVTRWMAPEHRAVLKLGADSGSCVRRVRDKATFSILCLVLALEDKDNG